MCAWWAGAGARRRWAHRRRPPSSPLPAELADAAAAALDALPPAYYEPTFDAAAFELNDLPQAKPGALPPPDASATRAAALDAALGIVSARLTTVLVRGAPHFAAGAAAVAATDGELAAAAAAAAAARAAGAAAAAARAPASLVARLARRRDALATALDGVERLAAAREAVAAAADGGNPAAAAAADAALARVARLDVSRTLAEAVAAARATASASLADALAAGAAAFDPARHAAAVAAWAASPDPGALAPAMQAAFAGAPAAAVAKAVRGAALTHARGGRAAVEAVRVARDLPALAALIPPSAFGRALRQALAVAFGSLTSAAAAERWHASAAADPAHAPGVAPRMAAALAAGAAGLAAARAPAWAGAVGAVCALLASPPAAAAGGGLGATLAWVDALSDAGRSFAGPDGRADGDRLAAAAAAHARAAFASHAASELASLQAMLDDESWARLDVPDGGAPEVAFGGGGGRGAARHPFCARLPPPGASFDAWLDFGNPWTDEGDGGSAEPAGGGPGGAFAAAPFRALTLAARAAALGRACPAVDAQSRSVALDAVDACVVHCAAAFAPAGSATLAAAAAPGRGAAGVPPRLALTLARVLTRTRPDLAAAYGVPAGVGGVGGPAAPAPAPRPSVAAFHHPPGLHPPPPTPKSHPGNAYALAERVAAGEALVEVAARVAAAAAEAGPPAAALPGAPAPPSVDTFLMTLAAAKEVRVLALAAAATHAVGAAAVAAAVAATPYDHADPPTAPSPWVQSAGAGAGALAARLAALAPGVSAAAADVVWRAALEALATATIDGFAAAGDRAHCTAMGRSAMSLDAGALASALSKARGADGGGAAGAAIARVSAYIQAYYVPWGAELRRWVLATPGLDARAVAALCACVGGAAGVPRRQAAGLAAALTAEVEAGAGGRERGG